MITAERHQIILDLLSRTGVVDLQSLVKRTKSSESTIRRDLSLLEEQGLLKRIHGGATLTTSKIDEQNIKDKSSKNLQDKRLIAESATSLIREGDCIYLDAGTTVSEMIPFLKDKNVVIVTNGLMHVDVLVSANITTYLIGGRIKANTKSIVGSVAQENLKQFRFDKCFLGMNGIDLTYGMTTPDAEEAVLKKIAIDLSKEVFVLVDKSKFTKTFFAKICDIEEVTIITTKLDDEGLTKQFLEKTNMKVVKP